MDLARLVEDGGSGQDRAGVFFHDDLTVIVVADGAGGMAGGDLAADRVIFEVEATLRTGTALDNPLVWSACLTRVDHALQDAGQSTALIVVVTPKGVLGASVGDSEARIFQQAGTELDLTSGQERKPLVGSGHASPVAFREPLSSGVLLVATDGFWKYARPAVWKGVASADDMNLFAFNAIEAVRLPSGHLRDDVALVACRLPGTPH